MCLRRPGRSRQVQRSTNGSMGMMMRRRRKQGTSAKPKPPTPRAAAALGGLRGPGRAEGRAKSSEGGGAGASSAPGLHPAGPALSTEAVPSPWGFGNTRRGKVRKNQTQGHVPPALLLLALLARASLQPSLMNPADLHRAPPSIGDHRQPHFLKIWGNSLHFFLPGLPAFFLSLGSRSS